MTQLEKARKGKTTGEMKTAAKSENISARKMRKLVANGKAVILASKRHEKVEPIAIGSMLKTKINANIGTSPLCYSLKTELEKARIAVKYGADTIMDLSTGGNIDKVRRRIVKWSKVPVGTVPIYQTVIDSRGIQNVKEEDFLSSIEKHVNDGVDFITVHAGVTRKTIPLVDRRVGGVVSRGGSIIVKWMKKNKKENPLYENFDEVLRIAKKYDVTLSLGDGLRPGAIQDATDKAQITELKTLGKLTAKALDAGVQVMVEGPGHVPINEIEKNMLLQKKYCMGAPFYVLGPLVTDIAPGYDHITSAIGGATAAYYGAAFLCYVTPAEHLRLPTIEDVKEGVIAAKIAAHAADLAKGVNRSEEWDLKMSKARKKLDWQKMIELAVDSKKALTYRKKSKVRGKNCTMCGKFCAIK